jgi:Meiotically up-regulated gene 113
MTIYFARVSSDGPIKIGVTKTAARQRLASLQIGCPWPIEIIGEAEGDIWHEGILHKVLSEHRMSGEWFSPNAQVLETIHLVVSGQFLWPERVDRQPAPVIELDPRLLAMNEVIDALGGLKAVADLTGKNYRAVCMWKSSLKKFPSKTFVRMRDALRQKGIEPDPRLWGMIMPRAQVQLVEPGREGLATVSRLRG